MTLNGDFNQPLTLTPNIVKLEVGEKFNQILDFTTAPELRILTFGHDYNIPFDIPDSLTEVNLGYTFDQDIVIPPTLQKLGLGKAFSKPLTLTSTLKELSFYIQSTYNLPITLVENGSLKSIKLSQGFKQDIDLVEGLEYVRFGRLFDKPIIFPSTLKHLEFDKHSDFNKHLDFPEGLEVAIFGQHMNHEIVLPSTIKKVEFPMRSHFNEVIDLPMGLREVTFGRLYTQPLVLPASLKFLRVFWLYNPDLILPDGCVRQNYYV